MANASNLSKNIEELSNQVNRVAAEWSLMQKALIQLGFVVVSPLSVPVGLADGDYEGIGSATYEDGGGHEGVIQLSVCNGMFLSNYDNFSLMMIRRKP